eukprot:2419721-Rhodomonas_salina.3
MAQPSSHPRRYTTLPTSGPVPSVHHPVLTYCLPMRVLCGVRYRHDAWCYASTMQCPVPPYAQSGTDKLHTRVLRDVRYWHAGSCICACYSTSDSKIASSTSVYARATRCPVTEIAYGATRDTPTQSVAACYPQVSPYACAMCCPVLT